MNLSNCLEKELYNAYQASFSSLLRFELEKGLDSTFRQISEERCKEILFNCYIKHGLKRKLYTILALQMSQDKKKKKDYEKAGKELFDFLYDLADEACEEVFLQDKNIEESIEKTKTKRPKYSK